MSKLKVFTRSKTLLIKALSTAIDLEFLDEKSVYNHDIDVYFHSGVLTLDAIKLILHSKKIVVNSKSAKVEILNNIDISDLKIEVVYPAIKKPSSLKSKKVKKQLCQELNIPPKTKLIFFTARTLKTNGVKEFFDIILSLNSDNYKVIIASNKQQITTLKFISRRSSQPPPLIHTHASNPSTIYTHTHAIRVFLSYM